MQKITQSKLIIYSALFLTLFYNYSFFTNVLSVYTFTDNPLFLFSVGVVLTSFIIFLLSLVSFKYTIKPILIIIFLVSSMTSYFMNSYSVVIDDSMIRNMLQTDIEESLDLLSIKQFFYFIVLGLAPAFYIFQVEIESQTFKSAFLSRVKITLLSLLLILATLFSFSKAYTTFFREHKPLRYTTNPTYWVYSIGKYIELTFNSGAIIVEPIGLDARLIRDDANRTKIVVMVVGEAARADHFSLNGYKKETNPQLKNEDIINFTNIYSCGTSTAESVPCMFSKYDRSDYSYKKGITTENVLDVLAHTNEIDILWRDNNSDSKGVALRLPFEDYKSDAKNSICIEGECRDIGMLVGLDTYINEHKNKDILIVLHQMGNHGPAYYKRYTKEFEKFKPVCETNQLEQCKQESISNAYDNALLYTDDFLVKTINFLKKYDKSYDTALLYMSDHGESLGESGLYLHGLPYFMAPDAQKHIGAFMWFGESMKNRVDIDNLKSKRDKEYSQDNLFHSLLGLFGVQTEEYDADMDIFNK